MRTRAFFITVLMATGLVASQSRHFCAAAMGRSAHAFYQYFVALRQEPLNPVERVMLSLVLANSKAQQDCQTPIHL
ncbi:MAG: hypothetical protein ABSG65_13255 [Bryobacteraceae bacterium]|jgi:hypothetical protein